MSRLVNGVGATLFAVLSVTACVGTGEETGGGTDAFSEKSARPKVPAPKEPPLTPKKPTDAATVTASDGGTLEIAEVVVLRDVQPSDDGTERPRVRLLASNQRGLCDRVDVGFLVREGEQIISIWEDAEAFSPGKLTINPAAEASGCSLVDSREVCSENPPEQANRGSGTLDITTLPDNEAGVITGVLDVTFRGARVHAPFEARSCAMITYGRVACGVISGGGN
jgi:hypothetical protein